MNIIRFLTLFVSLSLAWASHAQQGTVSGRVTEKQNGKALEFINVSVPGTTLGTVTNPKGEYRLELPPGEHTIVFSSVEFGKKEETLFLVTGKSITLNISLETSAFNLGEMTVKSEGKFEKRFEEVTVSMEVLKPSVVQNRNSVNVDDALQQIPGVNVVDGELQIRSGSGYSFGAGSRVMVIVDDMPLLSGDAGRPSWGMVPIENLDQIEVIKGASSVLYGSSALNGVIHVRTASPGIKPSTRFQMFTGIYDIPEDKNWRQTNPPITSGFYATHMQKFGNLDLTVGINALLEDGYAGPAKQLPSEPADTIKPGMFDNRIRLHTNTRYRFAKTEGLSVGLNAIVLYGNSANGFIGLNGNEGFFRFRDGTVTTTKQTAYNIDPYLEYNGKNGWFHSLKTRFFSLDNNNDNNQGNSSEVLFGEYQIRKGFLTEKHMDNPWLRDLSITAGVMVNQVYARSQIFSGGNTGGVNSQLNAASYAQIETKFLNRKLSLNVGLRWEYFALDTTREVQPVFRGGATFKAAEYSFIRASFGQGFRFPTIAERYISTQVGPASIIANPSLRPETSWSAEIGFKQAFMIAKTFRGFFDIAGYWQEYKDFVEFTAGNYNVAWSPLPFGFKSLNTGDARVAGVDVSIMGSGKIGNITLNLLAGYNYSLPITLTPDLVYAYDDSNNPMSYYLTSSLVNSDMDSTSHILKYRFRHTAKLDMELIYKNFLFGGSFRFNSFMENIDDTFYRLDKFILNYGLADFRDNHRAGDYVIDIRTSYQLTPSSKISLVMANLLNRTYSLRPMFPEPPRSFIVQYVLSL
jgi:outer membrane receptor protein involved in Fe transport